MYALTNTNLAGIQFFHVAFHVSLTPTATATDPLLVTPLLFTVGWLTVGWLQKQENVKKKIIKTEKNKQIVSLQANISGTPFDQKSPGHPEMDVLNCHRQTNRQTDIAQWADSVKILV